MKRYRLLIWFTQLGISVATPLLLCIAGGAWLQSRFSLDAWVILLRIVLGMGAAFSSFRRALRAMRRQAERDDADGGEPPVSFNKHI